MKNSITRWGRRLRLRRVSRPAISSARPRISLHRSRQSSPHRIAQYVSLDPPKRLPRPDQMVVTLVLPKLSPGSPKDGVSLPSTVALHPPQELGHVSPRRQQQMNVIRHDHPRVQIIVLSSAVVQARANNLGDPRLPKIGWSTLRGIQQAIDCEKSLAGCHGLLRKSPTSGQAAMQSEGHKQRLSDDINVRQTAVVEGYEESIVEDHQRKSQAGLETRRGRGRPPHSASDHFDAFVEGES
jgi:hypothetical protein